jgi:hypothetical protein
MEIGKFIEWSNADIKSLQFEAKKAPKAKEVELIGKVVCFSLIMFGAEMLN